MKKAISLYPELEAVYKQGKDPMDAEFKAQDFLSKIKKHEAMELEVFMWGNLLLKTPTICETYNLGVMEELHRITEEFLE